MNVALLCNISVWPMPTGLYIIMCINFISILVLFSIMYFAVLCVYVYKFSSLVFSGTPGSVCGAP